MGFNIPEPKRKSKGPPMRPGSYPLTLVGLVDLGTQDYNGKAEDPTYEVMFQFEAPTQKIEVERNGEKVLMPRLLKHRCGLSYFYKSKLSATVNAFDPGAITKDNCKGLRAYDLEPFLGRTVLGNVEVDGNGYEKIAGLSPMPEGMPAYPPVHKPYCYSIAGNGVIFPPEMQGWIQDLVKSSPEFKALKAPAPVEAQSADEVPW